MIFRGFAPRRFWICRSSSGGGCRRPADGCFRYSAQRAEGFCSRPFGVLYRCRLRRRRLPGPAPAGGPISCTDKKWGKEAAGGHAPLTSAPPPVGLRPKSAAPCHGSADEPTASRQPPRRGRNASAGESPEPYRKCSRGGTSAFAWRAAPTGRRKTARLRHARAQSARTPDTGVVFRWVGLPEPSGVRCWVRPQPELSFQLVYPWGVTVVCGYWQGTPGGFSRGLVEVPLSAFLPPTSWARKKSARPPGRVPAIYAAAGGSPKAPRRGAKKAVRPQRGKSQTAAGAGPGNPRKIRAA